MLVSVFWPVHPVLTSPTKHSSPANTMLIPVNRRYQSLWKMLMKILLLFPADKMDTDLR